MTEKRPSVCVLTSFYGDHYKMLSSVGGGRWYIWMVLCSIFCNTRCIGIRNLKWWAECSMSHCIPLQDPQTVHDKLCGVIICPTTFTVYILSCCGLRKIFLISIQTVRIQYVTTVMCLGQKLPRRFHHWKKKKRWDMLMLVQKMNRESCKTHSWCLFPFQVMIPSYMF